MPNKLSRFWQELVWRKVIYFLIGYVTACFAIIEFLNNASSSFSIAQKTIKLLYLAAAIGLPVVIIFPWFFYRKKKDQDGANQNYKSRILSNDHSIIVLPFENMSPDPDQEYFSDGLTEEIITDLSHIHGLMVISRSSAMTFKGTRKKVSEIASDVDVRYVLEGSVRKDGNNLRITAQLIEALTDTHLWAEKYTGTLHDIFAIQEKVSQSIAYALKIRLSSEEITDIQGKGFDIAIAYEQYLLARNEIWRCTKESLSHAIQIIEGTTKIIGKHEYLLTALALAHFQYVNTGIDPDSSHLDKADEYIDEALRLNNSLSRAHLVKSYIYETRSMLKESFDSIKKAIQFDPNDAESLMLISFLYSMAGRPGKAKPYALKAVKLDPLNPLMYFGDWYIHLSEGKLDLALAVAAKMYDLDKIYLSHATTYANTLVMNNRINEAIEIYDKYINAYPESIMAQVCKCYIWAVKNDPEKTIESVTPALIKAAEMDHLWAWMLAQIYSMIGEKDKAIDYVERATRDVFINYPFFAKHDPLLENIRGEERFNKLMLEVKQKWENFED